MGFATAGAHAVLVDHGDTAGPAAVGEIEARGGQATFYRCDVTDAGQVAEAFGSIAERLGRIDVLVNNAGGFTEKVGIETTTDEEWRHVMALNLTSAFLCTRADDPRAQAPGGRRHRLDRGGGAADRGRPVAAVRRGRGS